METENKGLPFEYRFTEEKYNLQGYDFMRIKLSACCPNYKCQKDITHIIEAGMQSTFCPYCGTKIQLDNQPQLPFDIDIKLHESVNNHGMIATQDDVGIW